MTVNLTLNNNQIKYLILALIKSVECLSNESNEIKAEEGSFLWAYSQSCKGNKPYYETTDINNNTKKMYFDMNSLSINGLNNLNNKQWKLD